MNQFTFSVWTNTYFATILQFYYAPGFIFVFYYVFRINNTGAIDTKEVLLYKDPFKLFQGFGSGYLLLIKEGKNRIIAKGLDLYNLGNPDECESIEGCQCNSFRKGCCLQTAAKQL